MNTSVAAHAGDLAETLVDLRRRFRQAARYEVARAVAEALRDAAMMIVCGPARPMSSYSAWDDPWADPVDDPWHARNNVVDADDGNSRPILRLSPAVLAGVGAARWSYTRTRQVGLAMLIGLLVALAAKLGGPTVQALLRAWSVAEDLLTQANSRDGR